MHQMPGGPHRSGHPPTAGSNDRVKLALESLNLSSGGVSLRFDPRDGDACSHKIALIAIDRIERSRRELETCLVQP